MDWTLEVVLLPVSDIERAIEFYRDEVGFEVTAAPSSVSPTRTATLGRCNS